MIRFTLFIIIFSTFVRPAVAEIPPGFSEDGSYCGVAKHHFNHAMRDITAINTLLRDEHNRREKPEASWVATREKVVEDSLEVAFKWATIIDIVCEK